MKNVSVCTFKASPCVPEHAHMCFNMCSWCRYKRGRFERTHGDALSGHTFFFFLSESHTTTRPQHHTETETETDRDRERRQGQRERREDGRGETRQKKTREEKRQDEEEREEAWPFLVGGVNRLVNFVDDRDPCLLFCVKYDSYLITGFIVQSAHYRIR